MLTLEAARALLQTHAKDAPWLRHCEAVARVAAALAAAVGARRPVDGGFVERAALLHDLGRCRSHDPVLHGVEGYRLLSGLGHPREARACLAHLLFAFDPAAHPDLGFRGDEHLPRSPEEALVPLADFLVEGERPTTLDARFASLRSRYAEDGEFVRRLGRSEAWTRELVRSLAPAFAESPETIARQALPDGVG
ncbi:MAG: HDIG domain-containing protein [Deferrisomatales bacterium]|nr:HDIG domain-containing protein [Deferrisomatales bacterium]